MDLAKDTGGGGQEEEEESKVGPVGTRVGCLWGRGAEFLSVSAAFYQPGGDFSKRTSIKKK